jgi:vanillate O-demethylase monooxygenase subunit
VTLGARPAGADTPLREPVHVVVNSFTPETDNTVHYFWSTARNWAIDDEKVTELYRSMIDMAFREDAAITARQQELIDSNPAGPVFVNFAFDRAGQSARRIVNRMIAEEETARQQGQVAAE